MIKRVQRIGHNKSAADLFLGQAREITINTTDNAVRVHDGATLGGHETARKDVANVPAATGSNDGKMTASQAGNLSTTKAAVDNHINAASGHPVVTTSNPGFASAADKTKLNGIEDSATADQSVGDIRALGFFDTSNDGSGSGLDADLLDGQHKAFYASAADIVTLRGELNAPTTTKAFFPQAAAPTGWVKDTDQNNKALRIVSGGTGGNTGGATAFTSVFGSGKSSGNYTLQVADIPAHPHDIKVMDATGGSATEIAKRDDISSTQTLSAKALPTGGGGAHQHTLSLNLQYLDIIKATKSA